ncbi:hypothetical protein, conserved [Trypanosoma brucei brucei TREU927]|uniref:RanBP2-type domain-containing protein n=1 Tax=Trypanosoma brucei brucei (strain 927/4 GUTat10.1) TaxID=185431 RepID=Q38DM6_TRYB2|nr:hypothetical protein, conserved [Trypanosoma brucei brucei TREU927]EAN77094.1 hypothetical protein, conserved [Trypanosoma brucei brucei TREU927]
MRPPTLRAFTSPHVIRHRITTLAVSGTKLNQRLSLLLGVGLPECTATEGLASSLRFVSQECLPPYLAFTFLSHCWSMWSASSSFAVAARKTVGGTNDSVALETLLNVSEECLLAYSRIAGEENRSQRQIVNDRGTVKNATMGASTPLPHSRAGYHYIVDHMLRICSGYMDARTAVTLLQYAVRVEDSEGAVFKGLVELLASRTSGDPLLFENCLRKVLGVALPVHVSPIVTSVLCLRVVTSSVLKLCMHHVATVVRGRQSGRLAVENALGGLHRCAVMALHWLLKNPCGDQWCNELCIQVMSCLKYAPMFLLCDVYGTMADRGLVTPSVQCKFLANCGVALGSSGSVPDHCGEVIIRAFTELTKSDRETRYIEEGLVHGSAALVALGKGGLVRRAYVMFPTLRVTHHLVMAHVHHADVVRACDSLLSVACSREEGWINIPPPVMHAIHAVCVLVGRSGSSADVVPLYRAIVCFHNPGIIVSQCMEYVLSGLCDRVARINGHFSKETQPCTILEHIVPLLRAIVRCIGDDINTDMILELLETALSVEYFSVPLTASIVWTFQRSTSLALKDLFSRVDPSTNGVPFLNYYALCHARDRGMLETVEHLATVWHCDVEPILKRYTFLLPSYKLWKCAACGRFNSDRFNYCLCSALRNGFVVCSKCAYAQDERLSFCQSCGVRTEEGAVAAAVVRRAWTCGECGANNPARQVSSCFRCKADLGPVAKALKEMGNSKVTSCSCPTVDSSGEGKGSCRSMHYCRHCGWMREPWAVANSTVWRCEGCSQLRSSLDRTCPECPHVDFLPFAMAHKSSDVRSCVDCGAMAENPFAEKCALCAGALRVGATALKAPTTSSAAVGESELMVETAQWCSNCGGIVVEKLSSHCSECGHALHFADVLHLAVRRCSACGEDLGTQQIGVVCVHCFSFAPPVPREGWSTAVVHETFRVIDRAMERKLGCDTLADLFHKILVSFRQHVGQATISETRVAVAVALGRLQAVLIASVPYERMARRVIALTKQLLEHVDNVCGVSSSHFHPGQCPHCLGTHRPELCSFNEEEWVCEVCGAENENGDVCRYVCRNCLSLRDTVRELCPTEAWECPQCQRANVDFESYCIFCGVQRAVVEDAVEEAAEVVPFIPAKCSECNLVHLEARCPLCHNTIPETLRKAEGVVCLVTSRYAFIQPVGTEHPNQRVYVGQQWLRKHKWTGGEKVTFTARLNDQGGFRVTSVHS